MLRPILRYICVMYIRFNIMSYVKRIYYTPTTTVYTEHEQKGDIMPRGIRYN